MPVTDSDMQRRASSFGAVASAYAEHRPDYPREAIRWALAPAAGGDTGDLAGLPVLDLGAGTGKLTAQLASLGVAVTAVEPDASMLAVLRSALPSVPALDGSAESIPLPDGSVRAVLCGQALHWFNLERALPEIARVLAPGGVLAGLWNNDDTRVEWVAGLHEAADGATTPNLTTRRSELKVMPLGDTAALFAPPETSEFPNVQRCTAETLVATISTHSKFLILPPPDQRRIAEQVRGYLRSRPETSDGEFTLPLVTVALRTTQKG